MNEQELVTGNIVQTISIVVSIVLCGIALIASIRAQLKGLQETMSLMRKEFREDIKTIFDKLYLKKDAIQCGVDRANCPCVQDVNNIKKNQESIRRDLQSVEDKHDNLNDKVTAHHAKYHAQSPK